MASDFTVIWQFFLKENNWLFIKDQTPRPRPAEVVKKMGILVNVDANVFYRAALLGFL
jgi:hypothetical protein